MGASPLPSSLGRTFHTPGPPSSTHQGRARAGSDCRSSRLEPNNPSGSRDRATFLRLRCFHRDLLWSHSPSDSLPPPPRSPFHPRPPRLTHLVCSPSTLHQVSMKLFGRTMEYKVSKFVQKWWAAVLGIGLPFVFRNTLFCVSVFRVLHCTCFCVFVCFTLFLFLFVVTSPPLSTEKLIYARLGVSRQIYVNVDSPNLGFPNLNFLGGTSEQKSPCILCVFLCLC